MSSLNFRDYLDFAENLRDESEEADSERKENAYLIGSILLSWMAIESLVNNMMQDFVSLPKGTFTTHEIGFLQEKHVRFENSGGNLGSFVIEKTDEFRRLEDKVLFLIVKFGGAKKVDKGSRLWQKFKESKRIRDMLSHPRRDKDVIVKREHSIQAIETAREIMNLLSKAVWKKAIKW